MSRLDSQVAIWKSAVRLGTVAVALTCSTGPVFAGAAKQSVAATPDFGSNVLIVSPSISANAVQEKIDQVYAIQQKSEFGSARNAFLFLPGKYRLDIPIGFYTQVLGLGPTPDSVEIDGNVHADASLPRNNATCTFWRGVEGFSVAPAGGTMQWAVSQAAPFRRMHIRGDLVLHQNHGWASGGWMSDSMIDGNVDSGSQQQWISRNSEWRSWTGANWNMVFVGVQSPPAGEWPKPPYTKVETTPVVREKPFIFVDARGKWNVQLPALTDESKGVTWHGGSTKGRSISLARFYIAKPGNDTAASINAQLAKGRNLLLTPGIYELDSEIRVTLPGTVVMGLGFATLKPTHGTAAMTIADVDGVEISGLLFDAGEQESPVLLEVGPKGSKARHTANPICLHDVFFRVGGAAVGSVRADMVINSSDTIVDHTWIWRADHGSGVGWNRNLSTNGLIVNGDHVTAYGLFVEHHQEFQVLWNGDDGRTYFYQSEIPYDPPDQARYSSAASVNGWASYKVAANVSKHQAWGLGIYSVFRYPNVNLSRAIEVPDSSGVRLHHVITVALGDKGEISNVINGVGGATSMQPRITPTLDEYPPR